jgi:hypothetical protein
MRVGPRRGSRDNVASGLQQVEDGSQGQESRPDVPRFDSKAPAGSAPAQPSGVRQTLAVWLWKSRS